MQYKVVKCKPWVEDMQKLVDEYANNGWELVSHSSNIGTAGSTFIFKKN